MTLVVAKRPLRVSGDKQPRAVGQPVTEAELGRMSHVLLRTGRITKVNDELAAFVAAMPKTKVKEWCEERGIKVEGLVDHLTK